MGIDRSPSHLRGFVLPMNLSTADIWEAEATYSTADLKAGGAIPSGGEKLMITTSGSQTSKLNFRTQQAGTPGQGKTGFIFKRDTETDWYGDNSINAMTDFQFIKKQSSVPLASYGDSSTLALDNGDLLLAYTSTEAAGLNGIVVKRMAADGSVFSSGTLVFNATTHVSTISASNPVMCQLPDESIILVFWSNYVISSDLTNIHVYRSTDSGASWNLVSAGALDVSLNRTTYSIGKLNIGYFNGQMLLVGSLKRLGPIFSGEAADVILQAASIDEGMSFQTIGTTLQNGACFSPSLTVTEDGFFLAYITSNNDFNLSTDCEAEGYLFPNAFLPFENRTYLVNSIAGTGQKVAACDTVARAFISGEMSSWKDNEGNIFVVFRNIPTDAMADGGNGGIWMTISTDQGKTWNYAGEKGPTHLPPYIETMGSDSEYLRNFSVCSTKGRTWFFCQPETTAGTIDNSILLFCLRGYSSVTLPPRVQDATIFQQFSFNHSYLPVIVPDVLPDWSSLTSGSPTVTLTTDGLKIDTTSTSFQAYKYTFISPNIGHTTAGCVVRFTVRAAAGGSPTTDDIAARLVIEDASHDYALFCRFSNTQIIVIDNLAGTTLGTATPNPGSILTTDGVEILMALGDGKASVFWRPNDHVDAKGWFAIVQNVTVTDGGGGGPVNNDLTIGNISPPSSGTVTSYWGEACIAYPKAYNGVWAPNLAKGFGNPGDLNAKLYPSQGEAVLVTEGLFISTQDGPAQMSDAFDVLPSSIYGIENIFHSQSPSPFNGWRSQARTGAGAVPSEFIPLRLDPNGENVEFMSDMLGIHLEEINFKDFKIEGYNAATSSWVVIATINNGIPLKSFRKGNTLVADWAPNRPYFFHDELAGAIVQIPASPHPVYREIETNSAGAWTNSNQPRPATIVLKNTEPSDPASFDGVIIPRKTTVMINLNGATYSAIGIRIDAQNTMTNDFRIGHLSIGTFQVMAPQYAFGREITFTANTETFEQPDGIIRSRNMGRGRRNFSITWTEPVDTTALMPIEGTPDPDYFKGSSDASARAIASWGGIAFDLLGYIRQLRGSDKPLVYLPSVKFATNASEEIRIYNRDVQHSLCLIDNSATLDNAIGDELVAIGGEAFRIGTIKMTEII